MSSLPLTAPVSGVPLLVVDDERPICSALDRFFTGRGYAVATAQSGKAALELLGERRFSVMLCDVRMPEMSGRELVPRALALDPDLAVVMLTAVNDARTATDLFASGALEYLVKPFELTAVAEVLQRAMRERDARRERRLEEQLIREQVVQREAELEKEKGTYHTLSLSIAETLINAMEAKDLYLRGHSQRVSELAASIAEQMGLDADTVEAVRVAGRLHDVGMIGIRADILHKPQSLSAEEFAHVKEHVRVSMDILAPLRHTGIALDFVRDHHEHVDGSGYPRGLRGDEISVGGRILAAADAFDALTSRRAYRDPCTPEETIARLETKVGTLLDRKVFDALRAVVSRRGTLVFIDELHA